MIRELAESEQNEGKSEQRASRKMAERKGKRSESLQKASRMKGKVNRELAERRQKERVSLRGQEVRMKGIAIREKMAE